MKMGKHVFWRTAIACGVAMATSNSAIAQQESEEEPSRGLEVIQVTSQKRVQSVQDVSVAVTAFDQKSMEKLGIQEPIDIAVHTPNLNVKNVLNKSAPIFTIRGIGNAAFTSNSVAPVGVYVDELFLPTNTMMSFSVFDTERVEVLKGPQGTLFGRNTTAGAVSFTTVRPDHDGRGYARIGVGNYESADAEIAKSFSLTGDVAARVSAKWLYQGEGTFTNRLDDSNRDLGRVNAFAVRTGFLFDLDNGELYVNLHGGRDRSENEPWVGIGRSALDNPTGPAPELPGVNGQQYRNNCLSRSDNDIHAFINNSNCVNRVGYYDPYTDVREGEFSQEPVIESDSFGALAHATLDFDAFSFVSITAFETLDKTTEEDFDGSPFRIGDTSYSNDIDVFSQELRLTSARPLAGKTDWITGLMYYQDTQEVFDLYGYTDRVNHDVQVDFTQDTTSIAAYLHTETQLSDKWKLIAGARITRDEISFDGGTTVVNLDDDFTGDVTFFSVDTPILVDDEEISSTELTYKVGLDYVLSDDVLLYGNFSHGYKAGVWNGFWAATQGDHSSAEPEFIDAVEFGVKSTLMDNTLRLNAAVFNYDYDDMQLFADLPDGRYTIFNAGSASVKGAEIEANWLPTDNLEIIAGAGYTDASVDAEVGLLSYSDATPANTPEFTYNVVARYFHDLSGGLYGYAQVDYTYQDDVFFSLDNLKAVSQEAYGLTGFRIGVESDEGWEASFWVKNLTDEEYFTEILTSGSAGVLSGQVGSPRMFGFTFKTEI
ncbi:TonB-dependent receptor [Tenacibaculum sp. KUL118]|nr:TonB-dependent receptor [Tenacibaculum sp. KUL118]